MHRYSIHCPSWTVIRQICEIFDDFFVFHCATLLCFIIVIYVIIVKCEVMTSLNTLCYVPLLLCINSNPYTCDDSGRFVRFLTTFFVFKLGPVEMCTFNFPQNFKNSYFYGCKVIYSEKGTKFCEILTGTTWDKSKVKISQKIFAFSEYMNFNQKG